MRFGVAFAWMLGLTNVVWAGADGIPIELKRLELPAIFRPAKVSDVVSRISRKPSDNIFELRSALASHEETTHIVVPVVDYENYYEKSDSLKGFVRIRDLEPPNNDPSSHGLPPTVVPPVPTNSAPIPLDAASRDDTTSILSDPDEKRVPASSQSSFGWIAGTNNKLGMLELNFDPLERVRFETAQTLAFHVSTSFGAKWLTGPDVTDLPPQLFNVLINVGTSSQVNDRLTIDAMISPGWYTDFSNKGIEAVRLPWHIVSYYKTDSEWRWVLGITDLSRQDIRLLPVVGMLYAPESSDVRWDLVFPKPRIAWRIGERNLQEKWLYLSGELGGGSWAISRADRTYDTVTYRDYRMMAGAETRTRKGYAKRLEIGWIFGRSVEYRSNDGNYSPSDTFMIRISSDH